jgi:hypothetical protein
MKSKFVMKKATAKRGLQVREQGSEEDLDLCTPKGRRYTSLLPSSSASPIIKIPFVRAGFGIQKSFERFKEQ